METSWRIVENVGDDAVNLGYLEAPIVAPSTNIATYDFSGLHADNVSTFPGRSRHVTASYDKSLQAWYLRSLYASDALITNKILSRKGLKRTVPLYYSFTAAEPLLANTASYDGVRITNKTKLLTQVTLLTIEGVTVNDKMFLYDLEFIPYNVHLDIPYSPTYSNVFYIRVLSNGVVNNTTLKIQYRAFDTSVTGGADVGGHQEYLSFEPINSLFNINYQFPNGYASDLIGFAYPNSQLNPLFDMDPNNPIPVDPDGNKGRKNQQYSLLYNYGEKNYMGVLSDSVKLDTTYQSKPAPLLLVYYEGVLEDIDTSIILNIDTSDNNIILIITEPGDNPKSYSFSVKGRASYDIAFEISNSPAPFSCFEGVRIDNIDESSIFIETLNSYVDGPTDQVFDLTSDNGMIIRSRVFIAKYTPEPTIQAKPPVDKSNRIPWNPRVKVGGYVDEEERVYFLNEYGNQQWSTVNGYPYVDIVGEVATFKSRRVISTAYKGLLNKVEHLALRTANGDAYSSSIEGIDAMKGLVYLNADVPSEDIFISYSYRESFYEVKSANLNPTSPHNAEVGKFHVISIRPFIVNTELATSTVNITILPDMPTSKYVNGDELILAVYLITDTFDKDKDYKFVQAEVNGGGISPYMPHDELALKVKSVNSLFDYGYLDGLRYPANCAIHYSLPAFIEGNGSIVLAHYDPASTTSRQLSVYGASKIPPGTVIDVWYSQIGLPPEQATVLGMINHNTVKIQSPLVNEVHVGSSISFPTNVDPLFTRKEIEQFISKFSAAGSYPIIESQ